MSNPAPVVFLVIGALTTAYFYTNNKKRYDAREKPLLKLPLIGDIHSSPIDKPLENWSAWSEQNGPIVIAKLFGIVPIVVLNSYGAVTELFGRRSQWYSNRPASVSMEMITGAKPGRSRFTLMHDYDDHLKLHHRILSPSLGAPAAHKYQPLIELEARQLLFDIGAALEKSADGSAITTKDLYPLLERTQSSVILGLHYGLRIPEIEEPILQKVIDIQAKVTHLAANPRLPDLIPLLRYLPTVVSPWQQYADKLFASQADLYMHLFRHGRDAPGWNATKQAIATATKHAPANHPVADLDLAFTLATSIQGGMETSPRQLLWLFVAALHNRDFVTRAHHVLDDVVGRTRLPRFSDRSSLAYIDAVAHELFRWRPKSKKGVTIMANAWAIGRDKNVFDGALGDAEGFLPERWLRGGRIRNDLPLPVFGQGRRICQGKRIATDGAFLNIAHLLWAFDIEAIESEDVDPLSMVVVGFMVEPKPFKFRLKPRGQWVLDLVKEEWEGSEKNLEMVMGAANDVETGE
ncbi:hypothetical protein COCMIDRAFT_6269 [Bipolaris oryzae ATCC 44560]|uniref:Cytochrome P450 n=1 Tax=Bipolaris oryzae ATCC 44560 TaxID=930090 RepID=W6ZA30_COCMI|nr:uncharacterized protein COCMIDRAFT_6269 [Bipolaris oryzae ATCC 44560]EUC44389.1 hypothetical protein COCMIDRAFT_6269 [Bipolaris oryzae ATCC 44560]